MFSRKWKRILLGKGEITFLVGFKAESGGKEIRALREFNPDHNLIHNFILVLPKTEIPEIPLKDITIWDIQMFSRLGIGVEVDGDKQVALIKK